MNVLAQLTLNTETLKVENIIFWGWNYKSGICFTFENMQRNKQKFFSPLNWSKGSSWCPNSEKNNFVQQPRCRSPRTRAQSLTKTHAHAHGDGPTPCLCLYALCSWHCLCLSLLVAPKLSPPDRPPPRGGNGRTRPAVPTAAWAPPPARNAARPPTSASPVRYL